MSDEERKSLEEGSFEVEELDEEQLEGVAGGTNLSRCIEVTNASRCSVGG
jgi:hypothetical protein